MGQQQRAKCISVRVTANELAAIAETAARAQTTVTDFVRSVALDRAGVQPFYSDEDRLFLLFLRDELRREGLNLTRLLITLNRDERFIEASCKQEILGMQRVIAALCVELSGHTKRLTAHPGKS
ncbi:hypothetical protein [Rhizobium sp. YS-1r]|uniref:plasmid mobilization protein n=1 Tax=Rhizobium sp. YS-1r TaxID=1532558 RepID=UPI000510377D|nr:hypothetical protein [Rhizobium sp. YS-1r]KGD92853.1 hypothetical protein JL39_22080 [Rhizobium sp. YS-1r]